MELPSTNELRQWANCPAAGRMVPVHPDTLRNLSSEIDRLRDALFQVKRMCDEARVLSRCECDTTFE